MVKVSVIIPLYNAERWLRQCLDSVVSQTLSELEIIVIDDGSTDASSSIVDEYAAKYSRVNVVHQKNGGYGKAVNAGLDLAQGEYFAIVEADDWIEPDMYTELYKRARELDVEVIKGPFIGHRGDKKIIVNSAVDWIPLKKVFTVFEEPSALLRHPSIWTALYKTDYIKKHHITMFEENKGRYADNLWRFETLINAEKITWFGIPFYHYRMDNECSTSVLADNPEDIFTVFAQMSQRLEHLPQEKRRLIIDGYYLEKYSHYDWNLDRLKRKYRWQCLQKMYAEYREMDREIVEKSAVLKPRIKEVIKGTSKPWYFWGVRYYFLPTVSFLIKKTIKCFVPYGLVRLKLKIQKADNWKFNG